MFALKMSEIPDQELIASVLAEGDGSDLAARDEAEGAFRILVDRYRDRIGRLLFRFTRDRYAMEDLAQEVFLKVYRKLHTFQQDSAFYTWLYRIAVNAANDYLERQSRRRLHLVEDTTSIEPGGKDSSDAGSATSLLDEEMREITRQVLAGLPEKYRTILILREYEDMAYTDMAALLECSIGTVESRLFRARQRFKEALERQFPDHVPQVRFRIPQSSRS